jgi:hypothetical protein
VIVGDADVVGVVSFPDKHDPPLLVDPDTVKIPQVPGLFLKAIAGWNPQVVQLGSRMELIELHFGAGLNFSGQFARGLQVENLPGLGIGETLDHACKITRNENFGKENYQK